MIFVYKAVTKTGVEQDGTIDAPNPDIAITSLQHRDLVVVSIRPADDKKGFLGGFSFFRRVKNNEVVMLSRQIATLFEAKVSVLSTFRLLAEESENPLLQEALTQITDDIKAGAPISSAMSRHKNIFSDFFVSMVKSGEESGKMSEAFNFLADYLDRTYAMSSKAKNALIYPAFVISSFVVVMVLMVVFIIPKLGVIIKETGQELPIYTKIVLGVSDFVTSYGAFLLLLLVGLGIFLYRYIKTDEGKLNMDRFKLSIPYVGDLYKKLFLSRIADNLNTMLTSGISMVRALEISAEVVDNSVYRAIMLRSAEGVKSGSPASDIFSSYSEIPKIMVQMMRVGEESGKLGFVLDTMSKFYRREVDNQVETLVGLIEPFMIVILGLGVALLLTAVLVPIYNLASGF
ncbi:MAG: type II secretion system F family protein [Candidatus Paceibacterota bacterium]|jgi:type IV pilus assembly protein PilC